MKLSDDEDEQLGPSWLRGHPDLKREETEHKKKDKKKKHKKQKKHKRDPVEDPIEEPEDDPQLKNLTESQIA